MNLENLTNEELLNIKEQIEIKLYSKNDFWNAVNDLDKLDKKSYEINEKMLNIKDNQPQLKKLTDLGFSLVIYELDKIGLINYEKDDIDNKFHGCTFNKLENILDFKNYHKPTQSDIDEIEKILFIKKEEDNEEINTNDDTINLSSNKHFCRR